jgi:glycosyl transferase, family 25
MGAAFHALAQGDLAEAPDEARVRMIPVYVINLKRSPERRTFMSESLAHAGVAPTFVTAVDGRERDWKEPVRGALAKTEAALVLSHRRVWRRFLRGEAEFAAVLEDDAHIGEGFCELLASDWRERDFDVAKLETIRSPAWISKRGARLCDRALHTLGAEHFGTAGYVVSRSGAQKLLRLTRALNEPLDHMMFGRRAVFERRLRVLQLLPAVIVQDVHHPDPALRRAMTTTLGEAGAARFADTATRAKPRGFARLGREADRLIQQARRALRFWPTMHRVIVPWR